MTMHKSGAHRIVGMFAEPHRFLPELSLWQSKCSCGWRSWWKYDEDGAVRAWLLHKGQRCRKHTGVENPVTRTDHLFDHKPPTGSPPYGGPSDQQAETPRIEPWQN